jgi:hypothetical protein
MLDTFIAMIARAMSKTELRDISYRAFCHPALSRKDNNLIIALCVYRENYLAGEDDIELEMCRQSLKLTKKQVKTITKGA